MKNKVSKVIVKKNATNMKHKVIGEGSYGCVIKPALECNEDFDKEVYKNKVSKVMVKKNAIDELKEMQFLSKLKGIEKYAVSTPQMCEPKLDNNFNNSIKKCKNPLISKYNTQIFKSDLAQLLLENGGLDLEQTIDLLFFYEDKEFNNIEQHDLFFTSLLNLFDGLIFFRENNIVHFDIKLINLVYNFDTNKSKFIDFGMMKKDKTIKDEYSRNKAWYAESHFNWPPENSCGDKWSFEYNHKCQHYRDNFKNYEEFLDKLVNTFDSYSLCDCLIELLNILTINFRYKADFIIECTALLNDYGNKSLFLRNVNLRELRNSYKKLLDKHSIYKTKNKSISPQIAKVVNEIKNKDIDDNILKTNCEKQSKDFNPKTKKCNVKCKSDFERNAEFKCVKKKYPQFANLQEDVSVKDYEKKIKSIVKKKSKNKKSLKKMLDCLRENKDYNPKTKRCNARCKKGETRNKDFKCVTIKNKQGRSLQLKSKSKNGSKSLKKHKSI